MTIPSFLSCSPRRMSSFFSATADIGDDSCPSIVARLALGRFDGRLVIDLDLRVVGDGADDLVGARDDLRAFVQTGQHLDIGGAGDAGFHFVEGGLPAGHDEHALNLFLAGFLGDWIQLGDRLCARRGGSRLLRFQIALLADGERLDRNGERVFARGRGDFGGTGEPRADFIRRVVHGDYHLEVFGFLAGDGALRGGDAGGAQNGGVADFGHMAFEGLVGNGVDGDLRLLAEFHVDDIGFVDFHFGGDQRNIGAGYDEGAGLVLQSGNHGLTGADRQVGDYALERGVGIVLVENVAAAREDGFGHVDATLGGRELGGGLFALGPGLNQARAGLVHGRLLRVVEGGLALEVLPGAEFFLVEVPGAVGILLGAGEIGFGLDDGRLQGGHVVVGGFQTGFRGIGIGLRGCPTGLLGFDVGGGLGVLNFGQQLALVDVVALTHQQFGDVAHGVGADVDVILGFDLAGGGDDAGQILPHHGPGLHRDQTALAINRAGINARADDDEDGQGDDYFPLSLHNQILRITAIRRKKRE